MLWTFALEACVSAVTFNAERASDDFLLNTHAIIGRSLVNICKGLEPRKCRSMRGVGLFFCQKSLIDNMGQLCIALGTLHIDRCSPRKPNTFTQTRQLLYKYQIIYISHKLHITRCSLIYTIICLKSVCLSGHVRRMQFAILDQSSREMSQTDRIHPRYFLSRVRVSIRPRIFLYAEKPQTIVARMLFASIHSAAR